MGFHRLHRKPAVAMKVNRSRRIWRGLLRLNRIFIVIKLHRGPITDDYLHADWERFKDKIQEGSQGYTSPGHPGGV